MAIRDELNAPRYSIYDVTDKEIDTALSENINILFYILAYAAWPVYIVAMFIIRRGKFTFKTKI